MDEKRKLFKISFILIIALVGVSLLGGNGTEAPSVEENELESASQTAQPQATRELEEVKNFTPAEFRSAYDNLSLPNIVPIIIAPTITGDEEADDYIRSMAEARGYKLRDMASGLLNELDGKPVQELLVKDWNDLQQAALQNGVNVDFVSGYRSIEAQRDIFTTRLTAAGATESEVAAGLQDDIVTSVLRITAPPGYSRHHGGYTIDLADPGFAVFDGSTAHVWLSSNNFENAKIHGFIPSYPEGLTNQGPNPEAWEFVWVGKQNTYQ